MPSWNSRGLRGSMLEEMINLTNDKYREKKLALMQKVPTPITPINIDKESRHITLAYFEQKSTVDYIGVVQGVPVCFDAKECAVETFNMNNIHEHQITFMKEKPLILVSNDDGITSKGIRVLVNVMKQLGDVVVVAPDSPQSGMGHASTIGETLRLYEEDIFPDVMAFKSSGTPADCVKLAKHYVLKDRQPDLVVSGINHGSNTSISVLYSGTMSAAIEGALEGLPSIGFSLCDDRLRN